MKEIRIIETKRGRRAYVYNSSLIRWQPIPYKQAVDHLTKHEAYLSKAYHPQELTL